jgi:hypothetical protein
MKPRKRPVRGYEHYRKAVRIPVKVQLPSTLWDALATAARARGVSRNDLIVEFLGVVARPRSEGHLRDALWIT